MKTINCKQLGTFSLMILTLVSCGKVDASTPKELSASTALSAASANETAPRSGLSYKQGYGIGQRNGGLMVKRLQAKTVDTQGCSAIDDLQKALLSVSKKIRAPATKDNDIARGFFRGYLDSIRTALQKTREGCNSLTYERGDFAGELYGSLLCQLSKVSVEAAINFEAVSLFDGWSGGSLETEQECNLTAIITLESCAVKSADLSSQLEVQINTSCSDIAVAV